MYKSQVYLNIIKSNFLKNSFWLTTAQGLNGVLNLFLAIYLARTFGPTVYGQFAYALSFVALFSTLFDFGLTMAVTREFAKDNTQEQHFQSLFFLKSVIGILVVLLISALSFFATKDHTVRQVIIMLGLYQLFIQSLNLFYAVFRARQRMEFEAFIRLFQIASLAIAVFVMAWFGHSIMAISMAYALATFFSLIVTIVCVCMFSDQKVFSFNLKLSLSVGKKFLLIGFYLALAQGVGEVMTNTDSFLLGYWGMVKGVGFYNAANKINAMVLFPMSIISTAIFPILTTALKKSEHEFMRYWTSWMKYTIFFAVLVTFLVIAKAEDLINLFYTSEYLPASQTLKILMVMAIFVYLGNFYFQVLLVMNHQRQVFYGLLCGSALNVLLNFILIPRLGIEGSALASVVGQLASGVFYFAIVSRVAFFGSLNRKFVNMLGMAVTSGLLMWYGLAVVNLPMYTSIFAGILLYSALFFILTKNFQKLVVRYE